MFDLLDDFLKYIDNWATCDIVCSNTKKLKKINNIQKYINSNNPWIIRFGLVTLLNYFIEKDNLSYIFNICTKINIDHYYVKMAISWLLSCCYIKYPKETFFFLKKRKLDKFTHNKTISKICDSKKVDNDCKKNIKLLKV